MHRLAKPSLARHLAAFGIIFSGALVFTPTADAQSNCWKKKSCEIDYKLVRYPKRERVCNKVKSGYGWVDRCFWKTRYFVEKKPYRTCHWKTICGRSYQRYYKPKY